MPINVNQYAPVTGVVSDATKITSALAVIQAIINGGLENEHIKTAAGIAASKIVRDTDATLAANSDTVIPSQKAVKAYADAITATGVGAITWTPFTSAVVTGWSSWFTQQCSYLRLGSKTLLVQYFVNGASNAVTAYIELPWANSGPVVARPFLAAAYGLDNGSPVVCNATVGASEWWISVLKGSSLNNWTATGAKQVGGQIWCELA